MHIWNIWNNIQTRCTNSHQLICMYLYLFMLHTHIHLHIMQCMHALRTKFMYFVTSKWYFIHTIALCLLRSLLPFGANLHFFIWRISCYFFWMVVIKNYHHISTYDIYIYIYINTHIYIPLYHLAKKKGQNYLHNKEYGNLYMHYLYELHTRNRPYWLVICTHDTKILEKAMLF